MRLIWKLIQFSLQIIAAAGGKKMLRPRETIGYAEISRRGGL
jgi:hypothetical protein